MTETRHFKRLTVKAGDDLIREGDRSDAAYFVLSGLFDVVKRVGETEVLLSRIEKDTIVGEVSMLDDNPRSATVRCVKEGVVVVLDRATFQAKVQNLDRFTQVLLKTLSRRLRALTDDYSRRALEPVPPPAAEAPTVDVLGDLLTAWDKATPADRGEFWRTVQASMSPEAVDILLPTGQRCRYKTSVMI